MSGWFCSYSICVIYFLMLFLPVLQPSSVTLLIPRYLKRCTCVICSLSIFMFSQISLQTIIFILFLFSCILCLVLTIQSTAIGVFWSEFYSCNCLSFYSNTFFMVLPYTFIYGCKRVVTNFFYPTLNTPYSFERIICFEFWNRTSQRFYRNSRFVTHNHRRSRNLEIKNYDWVRALF